MPNDLVKPYLICRIKTLNNDHCHGSRLTVVDSLVRSAPSSLLKAGFGIAIRFAGLGPFPLYLRPFDWALSVIALLSLALVTIRSLVQAGCCVEHIFVFNHSDEDFSSKC